MSDPRFRAPSFVCPHCGTLAQHEWTFLSGDVGLAATSPTVENPRGVHPQQWEASKCTVSTCTRYSFWFAGEMRYPAGNTSELPHANAAMPEPVRLLYDEAVSVYGVSRRAGAALARATLEALLRHVDPDAGRVNLDVRMARMEHRLSPSLWETLDFVRHVGNKALHVAGAADEAVVLVLDDEDEEIGPAMFQIVNDVVDETIVREQTRARLAALIPEDVRKNVERVRAQGRQAQGPSA